ncbi:helix-turn-helix domain-containing protein [Zunongwangia sp.]|uniref:helix-turn-helix domain-containing protein n=1 Tax=Zunongwangia sp. TaxID=1965325 RepID=UPI003AA80C64
MKIDVKTLPVREIIQDIATSLQEHVVEESGEMILKIPEHLGKGEIKGTNFDSGIGIITYNCEFKEDLDIHFTLDTIHPLKFIFCSKGDFEHRFEGSDNSKTVHTFQNIIVSSSGYTGHVLKFKKGVHTHISSLEVIRSIFSYRNNYNFKDLEKRLKNVFKDEISEEEFYYHGNYSIKSADLMNDMESDNLSGFLRSIFLEGKTLEMLAAQIEQYEYDADTEKLPQLLRKSDIEKVQHAVKLIEVDISKIFTVEELAKATGTNVNKLQDGFKYMYDLTVNKFIQFKKLEASKEMLMDSEKNISEIVAAIGLNNRSYFSKIFKEKYGVSPKYFLKKAKMSNDD